MLQAFVRAASVDKTEAVPFLEQYLNAIISDSEQMYGWPSIENLGGMIDQVFYWRQHLKLVAKFEPGLYMEQNKSTGNTFLNHILNIAEQSESSPVLKSFISMVMEECFESLHIPNMEGQTALDHILKNMISITTDRRHVCGRVAQEEFISLCAFIVANHPCADSLCRCIG